MGKATLVDCHTHTTYSDGASSPRENLDAAKRAGLDTVCFTDHLARPSFMDCSIEEDRIPLMQEELESLRPLYPELRIVSGFEADWYPGCERDIEEQRGRAVFVLGSVHYLGEFAIDWEGDMRAWNAWGADEVWRRYVDAWCEACQCPSFDSMAHPDLPRLFETEGFAPRGDLDPLWKLMALAAHDAEVRIEVSSSGLRKPFDDFYPRKELLERFREAGVPITVGSDAHRAEDVGAGVLEALDFAFRAGYRTFDVPTESGEWTTREI